MATSPIYGWLEPDNTDLVKNGALAIRTLGNAIDTTMGTMTPKSIVDAKGDLIAASANDTPARLAVGNDGETLVGDSSTSTGLRWQGDYAAGKNKIINGDFYVNQRNFTSTVNDNIYTFDRWKTYTSGTDQTYTAQTFTPGAAPVAGYEGANFLQIATVSGATKFALINQRIEDVRTFAGQTITVSFWAKAASGTPKVMLAPQQNFGSGGSSEVAVTEQVLTITSSWARYSFTVAMPSISGKTIGTGSYLSILFSFNNGFNVTIGQQTNTFQIWGVQAEAGSVATAFQTATGTLQGELAACQRYYYRSTGVGSYTTFAWGTVDSATGVRALFTPKQTMRDRPSAIDYGGTLWYIDGNGAASAISALSLDIVRSNTQLATVTATITGGTAGRFAYIRGENDATAYVGFSAEL